MTNYNSININLTSKQTNLLLNCLDYASSQLQTSNISMLILDTCPRDYSYWQELATIEHLKESIVSKAYQYPCRICYAAYEMLDNTFAVMNITEAEQTLDDELEQHECMTAAIATMLVSTATNNVGQCFYYGSLSECCSAIAERIEELHNN